jgi:hypothetical protein
MVVHVVGKRHLSGTSKKTGRAFDNTVLYVTCKQSGVDGFGVDTLWLSPVDYPVESIHLDSDYDVDRDNRGYIIGFYAVPDKI